MSLSKRGSAKRRSQYSSNFKQLLQNFEQNSMINENKAQVFDKKLCANDTLINIKKSSQLSTTSTNSSANNNKINFHSGKYIIKFSEKTAAKCSDCDKNLSSTPLRKTLISRKSPPVLNKPKIPLKPLRTDGLISQESSDTNEGINDKQLNNEYAVRNNSSKSVYAEHSNDWSANQSLLLNSVDNSFESSVVIRKADTTKIGDCEHRLSTPTSDYFTQESDRSSMSSFSSQNTGHNDSDNVVIRNKPIPRERTSITKNNREDLFFSNDNEINNLCLRGVRSNSLSPSVDNHGKNQDFFRRCSEMDQKDINKSFLWNSSVTNKNEDSIYYNINDEVYDDHLYEELKTSHNRAENDDEWIDIGSDLQKLEIEITLRKPPQPKARKSVRPKSALRKSNVKPKCHSNRLQVPSETILSDSGTEYEDIDDDHIEEDIYADNSQISNDSTNYFTDDKLLDRHSSHIYECLPESAHENNNTCKSPLSKVITDSFNKSTLSRTISDKLAKRQNSLKGRLIMEDNCCNSNNENSSDDQIRYSLTPHQSTKFSHFSLNRLDSIEGLSNDNNYLNHRSDLKRNSVFSRASSIYIVPEDIQFNDNSVVDQRRSSLSDSSVIPFVNVRAFNFHQQNSVTGSVVSYLEFTTPKDDNGSPFNDEPLYQFYQKDVCRRAELLIHADPNISDIDAYENDAIYNNVQNSNRSSMSNNSGQSWQKNINISAMDFVGYGPSRSLWCQLPQVVNSKANVLHNISENDKKLQEAMFEIITSEASYFKSLNILVTHFYNNPEFIRNIPSVLTLREKQSLFSNICEIHKISSNLLSDLGKRFQQNILLYDICDILYEYASNQHFKPYIRYCAYQRDQEKLLAQLRNSRPDFLDVLQRLESNQMCQMQTLQSFLMLPMQRITRYPLLVNSVYQRVSEDSPIYESVQRTLALVNQFARKCNEETIKVQRMQELIDIGKKLKFGKKVKSYPIVSGSRYLVKNASVIRLKHEFTGKKTIGKSVKWAKFTIQLLLFSDLLILAKKKSDGIYSVFDYCSREKVQILTVSSSSDIHSNNYVMPIPVPSSYKNLAQLILHHNHEEKCVEHTLSFDIESEKLRWIEVFSRPKSDNPHETIYETWDCPQVQCIRSYTAKQTDELTLEETDVINVYRKMNDGWYEGERIRDGSRGWFPSNFTEEIFNRHVIARNLRVRHQLLMLTELYIEQQKRCSDTSSFC